MENTKGNAQLKGKGFTLVKRLLANAIGPMVIMAIVLLTTSVLVLGNGMKAETIKGLRGVAVAARSAYNCLDSGDFTTDENGIIFKGDTQITDQFDIVDEVKAETGYDVTLFVGDTRAVTSIKDKDTGERIIGTKASDVVIDTVLNKGQEYNSMNLKINDTPYYVFYVPIKGADGKTIGMSFSGVPATEVNTFISQKITLMVIVAFLILVLTGFTSILSTKSIVLNISYIKEMLEKLMEGDFTQDVNAKVLKRTDELGQMAQTVQHLKDKIREVVSDIKSSSSTLRDSGNTLDEMATQTSTTTDEISHAIEDISKGAVSQAEEIETASRNISQMGQLIEDIVHEVEGLGKTSDNMKQASDESTIIINQLSASNDKTTEAIGKIGHQIHATNDSVQEIRQAVELITSIADETSLLSLNASIEAARAGEHGKGFAVVASEIQKLAEQSNSSARKIEEVIDSLLAESEMTVKVMEDVEVIVAEQQEKLNETKEKFVQVTQGVNTSRSETATIQDRTEVCDDSRSKVVDVISNLSAISEENAASTQETTASMQELNATINLLADAAKNLKELSGELDQDIQFFHV